MFGKKKLVLAGMLVFSLLVAGIGGTIVLAQGPTPTPTTPPTTTPTTPSTQTPAQTLADLFWQAFAQRLGTTVDKVQQAATDARKDAINQGVQKGLLTQNQADALLQRLQNQGVGGLFGLAGPRGAQNNVRVAIENAGLDAAAKTLGMSSADLTTALRGGKTLLTLAQEKNVDVSKLRTAIADAEKAAIDQAVKDGRLTQAQGDQLKANLKPENINLNRRFFAPGNELRRRGMMEPRGVAPFGGFGPQFPGGRFGRR